MGLESGLIKCMAHFVALTIRKATKEVAQCQRYFSWF